MCTGTRRLHLCPCTNLYCSRRDTDPKLQTHVVRADLDFTSWGYCD